MINSLGKYWEKIPHHGKILLVYYGFIYLIGYLPGVNAKKWWLSYLQEEAKAAESQCKDCATYKQKIVSIKDSSKDSKVILFIYFLFIYLLGSEKS